ncbi:hypothetical protein OUZ56_008875 [Daphnia magna]|uniref:Uncharacterized protein n=1 Tax=Daphnia magna TaxID=35525 RepID=A0ABR0AEA7_9CRUS|nr:hypothetical protein OUZ56_008875 [Daphnia magna]
MLSSSTIFTYRRFAVERELDTSIVVCRTGKVQQPFGCGTTPPQMDQPNGPMATTAEQVGGSLGNPGLDAASFTPTSVSDGSNSLLLGLSS